VSTTLGAVLLDEGCHFRVWAPVATAVEVEIVGAANGSWRLEPADDGYFAGTIPGVGAGDRYRYVVDGRALPDPCSRYQPDGPHGPSAVVDRGAYRWRDGAWRGLALKGQVIYELHIGTFTDEGTFDAAAQKLPYLQALGITAIEIMPVAECPGRFNWGYDGVNLFAPSHHYGDYEGLKRLVDEAHRCGIGVILDVVYNHLGPDGNYLTAYSPHYFTDRYTTDWGAALNFDGDASAPVREFVIANAREWVEVFHVDGLRLDATHSIFDSGPSKILAQLAAAARQAAEPRSIILISENEPQHATHLLPEAAGGLGLDAMWNEDFHHCAMVAATGRRHAYYFDYLGRAQEFVASARRGFLFQGQHYRWQKQPRGEMLTTSIAGSVAFLQNHDQVANSVNGARLHRLTSPALCRALTATLLLGPQTPLLFMGQEFHASSPFLFFADHHEPLRTQVWAGRKKFLEQFPGAASKDGQEAIVDPALEQTFHRSHLSWYECRADNPALELHRDLLAIRRSDPVISGQGERGFDGAVLGELVFLLRWFDRAAGDRLLIVNLGADISGQPAPEPLLACSPGHTWSLRWSSESTRYDGSGVVNPDTATGWMFPAQTAVLLVAVPASAKGEPHA
jgi:maltooligosyltrehalose trehalohydrolase